MLRRAIEALRRRYPEVTQERVAGQCGVDRSMVAKVWTGAATSNRVLITTIKAFVEAGWAPKREPVWARNARDLEVLAANLARTVLVEDREEDQLIPISRPAAP